MEVKFCIHLFIWCVLLISPYQKTYGQQIIETKCKTVAANVNTEYRNIMNRDTPLVYHYQIHRNLVDPNTANLRIEVSTDEKNTMDLDCPLLFSIRQRNQISSLEVPHTFDFKPSINSIKYYTAGRTLCIENYHGSPETRNISIRVSTCNPLYLNFKLRLALTNDFSLPIEKEVTLEVSPTNPKYLAFHFSRPDISMVRLRATSNNFNCMTVSVQTPHCPIFDEENNVRYEGIWQTMSTASAITLERTNRFKDGFIVALVVHHDADHCEKSSSQNTVYASKFTNTSNGYGSKVVKLYISNESKISTSEFFWCLFIPVFVSIALVIIVTLLFWNRHRWIRQEAADKFSNENMSGLLNSTQRKGVNTNPEEDSTLQTLEEFLMDDLGRITDENQIETEEDAISPIDVISNPQCTKSSASVPKWKWKADLYIGDFVTKEHAVAQKSSRRFYWTVAIVAIFYSIPVYQLIIHYLRVLYRTGEYDICYYNYLCAQRLWLFVDFNHFWSNISYIIFGFSFIFIVNRRASNLKLTPKRENSSTPGFCEGCIPERVTNCECCCGFSRIQGRWDYGIPVSYGIFYALGLALAMEGVLSAAYHLCPNQSSFQFDTCFMYVIAVLIILKIYQFRHPIHLGANHTFAILAGFVVISVLGLMFEFEGSKAKVIYRWIFISLQFFCMSLITIYYYSVGYVKDVEELNMTTDWKIYVKLNQLVNKPFNGDRLVLPILSIFVSVAVLIYSEIQNEDFATYLLYLLVANVLASTLYYVGIMKPLHGEFKNRTWVQPALYFLASGAIGGFAVKYFVRSPAQWEKSASASREVNEECMREWFPFHPFYDSHDVWHFLSSAALFLAFMGLLIVDDDLLTTPQSTIPVF